MRTIGPACSLPASRGTSSCAHRPDRLVAVKPAAPRVETQVHDPLELLQACAFQALTALVGHRSPYSFVDRHFGQSRQNCSDLPPWVNRNRNMRRGFENGFVSPIGPFHVAPNGTAFLRCLRSDTASRVRRGSHDPAGIPDRRSPRLVIDPCSKSICALEANAEGRRPSVGHSCGVGRPAHNNRVLEAQQKLRVAQGSQEPCKTSFSPRPCEGGRGVTDSRMCVFSLSRRPCDTLWY